MATTPPVPLPPPIDASSVDKLQLAADRSAINWHSFVGSIRRVLQDAFVGPYCVFDVLLRRPQALQPTAPNHPGRPGTLPPCTYVHRHGPHAGTPCGQTNHPPATCFKALDDAWFDRGNTGTPPRWNSVTPRPSLVDIQTLPSFLPAHLRLLTPSPPSQPQQFQQHQQQYFSQQQQPQFLQQQQPPLFQPQQPPQQQFFQQQQQPPQYLPPQWQQQPMPFGAAAMVAHASLAPPTWGSIPSGPPSVPDSQGSFLGDVAAAPSVASMYPSAINETSFQYPVSPPPPSSPTLDFVLDSGATEAALKDAGTLTPLPLPTQVHGLHIPTLRNKLLSHRELQGVGITVIYPGFANYCDLYQTSSGRFVLPIPLCPRTRLYTLRTPHPSFCHVTTRAGTSAGPLPPLPPPQVSPSPASLPSSLPTSSSTLSPSSSTALSHPAVILHHRLGHPNFAALRTTVTSRLLHSLPPTLPPLPSSPAPPCPSCIHGKLKQSPHHSHPTFAAAPIDLVHLDLWGPYPIRSRQGHRYMLVLCRNHFKRPIGHLHSDDGGEFINNTLATFFKLHGIQQTSTFPHSPKQNGIAESRIRDNTKIARCLIAHVSNPSSLWSYALHHAALLLNLRSHPQHPSSSPTELWSKAKPDAASLRVWGCKSFVLIPPADRSRAAGKLAPRALECVYLGHNRDSPGYLFLHPPTNRLIRSIDIVFDESIPYYSTPPPDPLPPPSRPLAWTDTVLPPLLPPSPLLPPVAAPLPPSSSANQQKQHPGQQQQQQQPAQQQGQQQQRQRHRATSRSSPFLLPRMHSHSLDKVFGAPPPASIQLHEDSHEEFLNIRHHTPFLATIFTPSTFKEAIACPDADRWIAAIFLECEAFIRNNSFVDVPLPTDANLVEGKWVFRVKQLPGEYPVYKARYCAKGFTQTWAEDYWFTYAPTAKPPTLRTLLDVGARDNMEICSMDVSNAILQGDLHERIFLLQPPGLFLRSSPRRFFILVYVDDMILLADSKTDMAQMKQQLQQRLKCKDLGDLTHYLGMAITRDRPARTITFSQSHYIGQILENFEMTQATRWVADVRYDVNPSRPRLPHQRACSFCWHWSPHRATPPGPTRSPTAAPLKATASPSAVALLAGARHAPPPFPSPPARLSSTLAPLAAQESRWLCFLLVELGAPQPCPTLWCDNASTIHLTQDPVYHARSKHIELRYFFIRELVQRGLLAVRKIAAEANLADIFTKALLRPAHPALLRLIGLTRPGAP
ncbi:unnamed protein product [Closterium sp. NIES-53]